jgi:hypothetical protein
VSTPSALGACYVGVIKQRGRNADHYFTFAAGVIMNLQALGSCGIYGYQTQHVGFILVTSKHIALQYYLLLTSRMIWHAQINTRFSFCCCFEVFRLLPLLSCLASCKNQRLLAGSCLNYFFDPEDGGDMFLRNFGCNSTDYTASHPRRWYSSTMSICACVGPITWLHISYCRYSIHTLFLKFLCTRMYVFWQHPPGDVCISMTSGWVQNNARIIIITAKGVGNEVNLVCWKFYLVIIVGPANQTGCIILRVGNLAD